MMRCWDKVYACMWGEDLTIFLVDQGKCLLQIVLPLSLPRMTNFKFPLQPHQKYNMKNLASYLTQMKDDYSTNSHYLTYTFIVKRLGECTFWTWELRLMSGFNVLEHIVCYPHVSSSHIPFTLFSFIISQLVRRVEAHLVGWGDMNTEELDVEGLVMIILLTCIHVGVCSLGFKKMEKPLWRRCLIAGLWVGSQTSESSLSFSIRRMPTLQK